MRAVALRVRSSMRRRAPATAAVAVLVAVVTAAVLVLAAGARRTLDAPDAYTRSVGGDIGGAITQNVDRPQTATVAGLPGVSSVEAMTFMFAGVGDPSDVVTSGTIVFSGSRLTTAHLVAGRAADPSNPDEFVADRTFVRSHHATLGQRFPMVSWTPEQQAQGKAFVDPPAGPSFEGVLVGEVDAADVLNDNYMTMIFSPALLDRDIAISATLMNVRLDPGVTPSQLRQELDGLPDGAQMVLEPGRIVGTEVRNAVDAEGRGLWIIAAVATVAAVVALGQLLSRHARLGAAEREPLVALGYTRRQLVAETLGRAGVPAAAGVAAGVVIAVLASGLFPSGFVAQLEPHPGVHADPLVLVVGAVGLLVALLAWVAVAAHATPVRSERRAVSGATEAIARRAPNAAVATGVRFALTRHDRSSTSALGTLAALAAIVLGLVGAATFAVSLGRLVSQPGRFGSNFSFSVGDNSGLGVKDLEALGRDPDVENLTVLMAGQARAGDTTVALVGIDHVEGNLAPIVLSGRLPAGPDELALGRVTGSELHLHVGDRVTLDGSDGSGDYRVTGFAVLPTVGGNDGVGQGAALTPEGFTRLQAEPDTALGAVVMRPGSSPDAGVRIAAAVGQQPAQEDPPAAILNVGRVKGIPGLLAALLGVLALVTLVHALVVSIQSRRRDVAVLKALGADRRWISRAVHWQATVLAAAPLVIGIPLGVIAGSVVFRAFVERIGALPDPALPIALLVGLVVTVVVVANAVAVLPARRARLVPAATLLREE